MSGEAVTDYRQVQRYLDDLGAALAFLPPPQAAELHAQITSHLEDVLGPGASDEEVEFALTRLGSPADLAAEARSSAPEPAPARRRRRLPGPRLTRRAVPALTVIMIVAVAAGCLLVQLLAPALTFSTVSTWYYSRDRLRARSTSADGYNQTTAVLRPGQRQGIAIALDNPSDLTQTVLGSARYTFLGQANPEVSVATVNSPAGSGTIQGLHYVYPGVIPPHQTRYIRVLWTSGTCLSRGATAGTSVLALRVRVGWFTRTEKISLDQGFSLSSPARERCP